MKLYESIGFHERMNSKILTFPRWPPFQDGGHWKNLLALRPMGKSRTAGPIAMELYGNIGVYGRMKTDALSFTRWPPFQDGGHSKDWLTWQSMGKSGTAVRIAMKL